MKRCYVRTRFSSASQIVIDEANEILVEYTKQGFVLTLRQLYYQFVARDKLPNTQRSYDRLGSIISKARLSGLVDWNHLIDRTRKLSALQHFVDEYDAFQKLASWYHIDFWENQQYRPEVWIEKDALVGVIERPCEENDVPFVSCRGYTSQSLMWRAAQRMIGHINEGQTPLIIHLGDHDPSGIDMSRDLETRLHMFGARKIDFTRVALNMDQVEEYDPPPNPTKITDSRAAEYIAEYGENSWELDALEPSVIEGIIRETIDTVCDGVIRAKDLERKQRVKYRLQRLADGEDEL